MPAAGPSITIAVRHVMSHPKAVAKRSCQQVPRWHGWSSSMNTLLHLRPGFDLRFRGEIRG